MHSRGRFACTWITVRIIYSFFSSNVTRLIFYLNDDCRRYIKKKKKIKLINWKIDFYYEYELILFNYMIIALIFSAKS